MQEYVDAANYAHQIGLDECAREMMEMSAVEAEHEVFFREIISNHRLLPVTRRFFAGADSILEFFILDFGFAVDIYPA